MFKKVALFAAALAILAAPSSVLAQAAERTYRIGVLHPGSLAKSSGSVALFQALRGLGYVEGRNTIIERRYANGRHDRLPEMAADLVRRNVDVIFVCCQPALDAARKATSTIPIVVGVTSNWVAQGLIDSLRRPGGNVTGLSSMSPMKKSLPPPSTG